MSEQQLHPPTPIVPPESQPERFLLGSDIVAHEDTIVYNGLLTGMLQEAQTYSEALVSATKDDPDALKGAKDFLDVMGASNPQEVIEHIPKTVNEISTEIESEAGRKQEALEALRKDLTKLSSDKEAVKLLDEYMGAAAKYGLISMLLIDAKKRIDTGLEEEGKPKSSWLNWLSESASDEEFTQFFQWHSYIVHETQNTKDFGERVGKSKELYKRKVATGIAEGWIDKSAELDLDKADRIEVQTIDIFIGLEHDGAGLSDREAGVNGLMPEYEEPVFDHEMNHQYFTSDAQLVLFDEVLTELEAQGMNGADIEDLSACHVDDLHGEYKYFFKVYDKFRTAGKVPVPSRAFTLAHTARDSARTNDDVGGWSALRDASREAFGVPRFIDTIDTVATFEIAGLIHEARLTKNEARTVVFEQLEKALDNNDDGAGILEAFMKSLPYFQRLVDKATLPVVSVESGVDS